MCSQKLLQHFHPSILTTHCSLLTPNAPRFSPLVTVQQGSCKGWGDVLSSSEASLSLLHPVQQRAVALLLQRARLCFTPT